MDIKVPADYEDYLHQLFNDYMQLPSIEEREGRHPKAYFDFGTPEK
jgi:lipopolysaccharide cholinephosphotransferase